MGNSGARWTKISKNTGDGDTVVRLRLFLRTEFVAAYPYTFSDSPGAVIRLTREKGDTENNIQEQLPPT